MFRFLVHSMRTRKLIAVLFLFVLGTILPISGHADKKKKASDTAAAAEAAGPRKFPFDPKKLVWPAPPSVGRIHWLDYFAGMKIDYSAAASAKAKQTWMDRLAGAQSDTEQTNSKAFPFQLIGPYGIAIDSKGLVYVAMP